MPKLYRVRVVNAQFNEGRGLYQDFRMPFYGRNATYELGNGMGKSVLLMLILQCVLPNAALDPYKPFKDMFVKGERDRTTHVLAEWELDEGVADKKYLLTGFCAKRKSDHEDEWGSDEIKYFSYLHLYDEPNDLDIENIPLCREERADFYALDYSETRKMLRENTKAGYDIWIAETRQEYLERLKRYYLLESEWNLIKKINRQESYLKNHFHKFRDSRALVENLLIKEIDGCLQDRRRLKFHDENEDASEKTLADALYQSQEQLHRLQEEQARLHEYERLKTEIATLQGTNDHLLMAYQEFDEVKQKAASQSAAYKAAIVHKEEENRILLDQIFRKKAASETVLQEIEKTKLKILNVTLNLARQRLEQAEEERDEHECVFNTLGHRAKFARATNKYILIRKHQADIREREEAIKKMEEDHHAVFARIRSLGKILYDLIAVEKDQASSTLQTGQMKANATNTEIIQLQQALGGIKTRASDIKSSIAIFEQRTFELEAKEKELIKQHERCPKVSSGFFLPDQIEATMKRIAVERETYSKIVGGINEIEQRLSTNEALEPGHITEIEKLDQATVSLEKQNDDFTIDKDNALQIAGAYGLGEIEPCATHLKDEIGRLHSMLADCRNRRENLDQDLKSAEKYGITLGREYREALERMQEKYPTAMSGAEYLKGIPDDERKEKLNNSPWLPKAVLLLGGDFKSIVHNPTTLPVQVQDAAIVITSVDHLREKRPLSLGDVIITSRTPEQLFTALASDRNAERLRQDLIAIDKEIQRTDDAFNAIDHDYGILQQFLARYPTGFEDKMLADLQERIQERNECVTKLSALQDQIKEDRFALPNAKNDLARQDENINLFEKKLTLLTELSEVADKREQTRIDLEHAQQKSLEAAARQRHIEADIHRCEFDFREQKEANDQTKEHLRRLDHEISEYEEYANEDVATLSEIDIDRLRDEYRGARQVVDKVVGSRQRYETDNARSRDQIKVFLNDIEDYRITIEEIEAEDPRESYSDDYLKEVDQDYEAAERLLRVAANRYNQIRDEHHLISLNLENAEEAYGTHVLEGYTRDPDLIDSEPLESILKGLRADRHYLNTEIAELESTCSEGERELENYVEEHRGYELLDSGYQFIRKDAVPASNLIGYLRFQEEFAIVNQKITKEKERFGNAKEQFFRNVDGIDVPHYLTDTVREKIRIAESAVEAASIKQNLEKYAAQVTSSVEMIRAQVEGLLQVETKIVEQALGMAMRYRDYLRMIPSVSKIEIDGRPREMLQINFDECIHRDEVARGEMHRYIQDLTTRIHSAKLTREELKKALAPSQLVGRVMDLERIRVKIRKIDINAYPLQLWDKIKASEGQENTMYIILLVVLISTIRALVIGRPDRNTAKVLFVDNPFGSTGSYYLWEKIWAILDRNNVQMICSGHKIDAKVREFFPISYLLMDEISTGGRMRIGIKFIGAGRDLDRFERQKRGEILAWTEL